MNFFDFFVNMIFAPVVIIFGLYGNLAGLVVLTHGKIKKIGPTYIYRFLFIVDTLCLTQCLVAYMKFAYSIDLSILDGPISCKLLYFIGYSLDAISPYLLVYISVEKYIAITYPFKSSILRSRKNQFKFLAVMIIFNGLLYLEVPFYFDVINIDLNVTVLSNRNRTVDTYFVCAFKNYTEQLVTSYIDLINRLCVPLILMTCFSILLINAIFKSRRRIVSNTSNENRQLKRDIRFAVTSFSMNLLFFALNLPISVVFFVPGIIGINIVYFSSFYFYFITYAINFYVMIATNSLFRKEFLSLYVDRKGEARKKMNKISDYKIERSIKKSAQQSIITRERKKEFEMKTLKNDSTGMASIQ